MSNKTVEVYGNVNGSSFGDNFCDYEKAAQKYVDIVGRSMLDYFSDDGIKIQFNVTARTHEVDHIGVIALDDTDMYDEERVREILAKVSEESFIQLCEENGNDPR